MGNAILCRRTPEVGRLQLGRKASDGEGKLKSMPYQPPERNEVTSRRFERFTLQR